MRRLSCRARPSTYRSHIDAADPRSKLAQDDEFALFNVTVFKKTRDEFVQKAREHKYVSVPHTRR